MKLKRAKRQSLFLKKIYLHHFRNHENREFVFGPHINVIYGDNARGKTNLLEAISLISTGRSFRTQHLFEIIQEGKKFFYIEATFEQAGVEQTIKMSFDGKEKKLQINSTEFSSFNPLLGSFPSIFSLPSDMELVTDSPAHRRRFLNLHLAQSDPMYVHYLARFWRACKQRNCLLKSRNLELIFCYETEMAQAASYLFHARKMFLDQLREPLLQQTISSHESIALHFKSTYPPLAHDYQEHLKKMRTREQDTGITLHGPHRDDFVILINDKSAQTYASEGQKKTIVTALRFCQWHHLIEKTQSPPLFVIDDYEGMLDEIRQIHLKAVLKTMGQVFVTTPHLIGTFENSTYHKI
ncbi:MAG TPA: DNA replication and repair protein RecF [Chlamydiales bacterium]|nr:DNA replication and repair protein RecF [Chlamydiales bacterium]